MQQSFNFLHIRRTIVNSVNVSDYYPKNVSNFNIQKHLYSYFLKDNQFQMQESLSVVISLDR